MSMGDSSAAADVKRTRDGFLASVTAYLIWGLVPLYFKRLAEVPATEIIAHRVLWSLLFMAAVLGFGRGFADARAVIGNPRLMLRVTVASALVMTNWLTFVYGVNADRILETSLGYFILPLVSISLGLVVLGERLRPLQWLAVALGATGVAVEAVRVGGLPWISLVLAGTFGIYGLLRKQLPLDAASGLFLETASMTPVAVIYLWWLSGHGGTHFGASVGRDLLLAASGLVTAIPLLLFAIGARRLRLNAMGFLQYLAPSMTFLLAVFVYGEPFGPSRVLTFAAIWAGLLCYSVDLLRQSRRPRAGPPPEMI